MDDTSPEIKALVQQRMMALSGEDRFIMGAQMFETAREIVLSSIPSDLPEDERLRRLAERFYGPEIAECWAQARKRQRNSMP